MMKYTIVLLMSFLLISASRAQIGINVKNPQKGALHIDPRGNNLGSSPSETEVSDDIFISNEGNVGIGNIDPQAKFHLKTAAGTTGSFKLEDGTQKEGRILKSDDYGRARWAHAGEIKIVQGVCTDGVTEDLSVIMFYGSYMDTKAYIDLPPGRWMVSCLMTMRMTLYAGFDRKIDHRSWVRCTFSDEPAGLYTDDLVGSVYASGLSYLFGNAQLNGFLVIRNNSILTKRYYFTLAFSTVVNIPAVPGVMLVDFAKSGVDGNSLIAFKMSDL